MSSSKDSSAKPGPPSGAAPVPTPGPPPNRSASSSDDLSAHRAFGRVAEDGTVFVKEGETERAIGQYPEGTPEEALDFYAKRFLALDFEVQLLEKRVHSSALSPDQAAESIKKVAAQIDGAAAVGDLPSLTSRLDALGPVLATQREQRKVDRAKKQEESRDRKAAIVAEAEKISASQDWRHGVNRLRDLLTEWQGLPRLDRKSDDELWHRFSGARTSYTKARKAHFAELQEQRKGAAVIKQKLCKEAEALAGSTDWGPTSARFRALMKDWKAAGGAPRDQEADLWARFRGAQDTFFGARDAANAELDKEYQANAEVKLVLLEEAEALVPVKNLEQAKRAFRDIAERWESAGKVPRDQIRSLEGRMRKVEQAIRESEDAKWKKTDPEKSARADSMIGQLEAGISELQGKLAKADAAGDASGVKKLQGELDSKRAFLEMAQKAASDFGS